MVVGYEPVLIGRPKKGKYMKPGTELAGGQFRRNFSS